MTTSDETITQLLSFGEHSDVYLRLFEIRSHSTITKIARSMDGVADGASWTCKRPEGGFRVSK